MKKKIGRSACIVFLVCEQVEAAATRSDFGTPITVEPGGSLIINSYSPMYPIILSHPGSVNVEVAPDHMSVRSEPIIKSSPRDLLQQPPENALTTIRSKLLNNCQECWKTLLEYMKPHFMKTSSLCTYIKENKWSLGLKSLAGAYVILSVMLFRMASFLTAPERWMYWRSDILLTQMIRMNSADIMQELLVSLGTRIPLSVDQKTLHVLLAELDNEIYQLQRYSCWADRIIKLGCAQRYCAASAELWMPSILGIPLGYAVRFVLGVVNLKNIIYINEDLVQRAPEYLRRLMYLRHIVEQELVVVLPQANFEGTGGSSACSQKVI